MQARSPSIPSVRLRTDAGAKESVSLKMMQSILGRSGWFQRARLVPHYTVVALLLGVAYAAGATAASLVLPPLVQPSSTEHHVGKIIWAGLVTPDLDAAKRFYGGLFGWSIPDAASGNSGYTVAYVEGRPVPGFSQRATTAGGSAATGNCAAARRPRPFPVDRAVAESGQIGE
jgi:hypothetical protein